MLLTHLKYLAGGTSREVYLIDDNYILKVAKNPEGITQNRVESNISRFNNNPIAITYYNGYYFDWIIQERADIITNEMFSSIVGIDSLVFLRLLRHRRKFNNPYYYLFDNFIERFNLHRYEICAGISYFGLKNNNLVIIDYGTKI